MKLITRDTDYAVRALCYMARYDRMVSAAELTAALRIPRPFLRRILQRLGNGKVLRSHKGNKGGFELAVPADTLSLLAVMRIFQGKFELNECFFKRLVCPNRLKCTLRKRVQEIERYAAGKLQAVSIGILAAETRDEADGKKKDH